MPPELKARATAWITEQRAKGHTVVALAARLGVAPGTILRWSEGSVRAVVPVHIVPDETSATVTVAVVSPSGFRIEGLSLADAARVLRELG